VAGGWTSGAAWAQGPDRAGIDREIARAMETFHVPGVAVAVVKNGERVLARGYGVREIAKPEAVDEDTLFAIASNSKAFTCAALSLLVEEGKLGWDDRVVDRLPGFQMDDPWVTREVRVRDLVTHRAGLGLGAGDLMWWPPTTFSRSEIVAGIRHLRPASSIRSRYAYNNVMFVAAGELVAAISGESWDDFVHRRILEPLGMTRTLSTSASLAGETNRASPHIRLDGATRAIAPGPFDNAAAAAGIRSSAADLSRWLRMLLICSGTGEEERGEGCLLEASSIDEMWTTQIARKPKKPRAGLEATASSFSGYGLGFGLRDERGHKVVSHSGALPGFYSRVTLVPDQGLGLVVLTNQESEPGLDSIDRVLQDAFLGPPEPPVDWVRAFGDAARAEAEEAEAKVAEATAHRDTESQPSLPLSAYVGRYRDPWYGAATVEPSGEGLALTLTRTPHMTADLEHWQHDTFVARWRQAFMSDTAPADAYVTFWIGPAGSVEKVTLKPVSPAIDFSFDFQDLELRPVPAETTAQ
jgi:CubicO group peptidase (beta-lactamase class C family)